VNLALCARRGTAPEEGQVEFEALLVEFEALKFERASSAKLVIHGAQVEFGAQEFWKGKAGVMSASIRQQTGSKSQNALRF
jgi:hypothetical protein